MGMEMGMGRKLSSRYVCTLLCEVWRGEVDKLRSRGRRVPRRAEASAFF